ncbi:MAG: heme exporter protein CcmD [Gluconacetobacter sp.]|uniref:Heme exporter protein CcmD n=1 Tax=Gluconacetobacter dulcium TaxID=2729096 RepID=A0A7W4JWP9_9PROT|nr:heme exporter protein CcmD [Gluconacetobacter dulcium]MBB2196126.1 heme exporter protein CcmD [Gluconacetobacter dulcium]
MTHLPYIVAAYGMTIGLAVILGTGAALRLRRARARLAAIERPSRAERPGGVSAP